MLMQCILKVTLREIIVKRPTDLECVDATIKPIKVMLRK